MLSAVARTNKVNTNVHDASSIFRDVYIHINYVDCGTAVAGFDKYFSGRVFCSLAQEAAFFCLGKQSEQ